MMFGAVSGSATAAVSSVGGFMIPELERKHYGKDFSVALTTTSATTGLLIPPSNVMIVYAVVAGNVSVAALFVAGILPGVLLGLLIMGACFFMTRGQDVPAGEAGSLAHVARSFVGAVPSMFLVVIVMGGILSGIFSATEASAVAVVYSLILGVFVYREISVVDLPKLLLGAAKTTSIVMLLIGASQAMSWVLALEQVPQRVSEAMLSLSGGTVATLLLINVLLLIVGTFMDMTPASLIFTPIFLPVVTGLGMHPVHFGVLLVTNLCIGLCTPPVGTCLFVGCGVGNTTIARVIRPLAPIFAVMVVGLLIITFAPDLSLWLPRAFGLDR
jgi:tripartite ATP-independent transporter DctM subunit